MFVDLDFLPIAQKSAIAACSSVGRMDKYQADDLATQSMRENLNKMPIDAQIVIGEGELDDAPMLFIGEKLGKGGVAVDIAVDPLEGTNLAAKNQNNAITVLAVTPKGGLRGAPDIYMKKIATGREFSGLLNVQKSLGDNLEVLLSKQKRTRKQPLCVALLDRERHSDAMKEALELGCKLMLLSDGDILPAIFSGIENSGIDLLYGIGAAPEGVISAAALKILGGEFQGIFLPENQEQEERCLQMGILDPLHTTYSTSQLVSADEIQVVLSAVTNGILGAGVEQDIHGIYTVQSLKLTTEEPKIQKISAQLGFHA